MMGDVWDMEEVSPCPIAIGQHFVIEILAAAHKYEVGTSILPFITTIIDSFITWKMVSLQVFINGVEFCMFSYRTASPLSNAKFFYIQGDDVSLKSFNVEQP